MLEKAQLLEQKILAMLFQMFFEEGLINDMEYKLSLREIEKEYSARGVE